jgi:hypothetical protein
VGRWRWRINPREGEGRRGEDSRHRRHARGGKGAPQRRGRGVLAIRRAVIQIPTQAHPPAARYLPNFCSRYTELVNMLEKSVKSPGEHVVAR